MVQISIRAWYMPLRVRTPTESCRCPRTSLSVVVRVIAAQFLLCPFIVFAADSIPCSSEVVERGDFDATVRTLRAMYQEDRFIDLDRSIGCLMDARETFDSGEMGANAVYRFFVAEMPAPGVDADDADRISKWQKAIPSSSHAEFASLRMMYGEAWNSRGDRYASGTSQVQFRDFNLKLQQTATAILSLEESKLDTPTAQNLLLAVALDSPSSKIDVAAVVNSGVEKWPRYYEFYEIILSRTVPKWGGSWEAVDQYIRYWSESRKALEGNSLYSRLYYFVHSQGYKNKETLVDWPTMKSSLQDLVLKYPVAKHRNIAAAYACIYGDMQLYFENTHTNIMLNTQIADGWLYGLSQDECDEHYSVTRPSKQ